MVVERRITRISYDSIMMFNGSRKKKKSWDKYPIDFTHVFEREEHTYPSTLDHFFWSEGISCNVVAADVLHLPNNTSDHCPIYCIVDIKTMSLKEMVLTTQQQSNPSWKRATFEQRASYRTTLENELQSNFYRDVHCKDEYHIHECGKFLVDVLESIK